MGILSATGHLTAVTYLAQVLEIKIKSFPLRLEGIEVVCCCSSSLLYWRRKVLCSARMWEAGVLFCALSKGVLSVSHREDISHYTAAYCVMSVSCPVIFVNDVSLFKSLSICWTRGRERAFIQETQGSNSLSTMKKKGRPASWSARYLLPYYFPWIILVQLELESTYPTCCDGAPTTGIKYHANSSCF